jgi:NADH-quinone oxidoreductase subunit M
MNPWDLPWIEIAIALPLLGGGCVALCREPIVAFRWGLAFSALTSAAAGLAWIGFRMGSPGQEWGLQSQIFGRQVLHLDALSAPLVPLVALLYLLTIIATPRTKMGRFSFTGSFISESLQLAAFSCSDPWVLIGLLAAGTVPPFVLLRNRDKPTRVYAVHMALFVTLLVGGRAIAVAFAGDGWATVPLMGAVLLRCGTVPAHCWITDWFEHSSFGNALLFVAPLTGVYAAVRLVLPIAPDWVLQGIGIVSLFTAIYAAGMATVQRETRRFFAYLFISHASLVLLGLELVNSISLTGALCLWLSVALGLGGLGLTLRAVEGRVGRLTLVKYHGLYEASPALAVCFLLTGLASVGFPGTLGFVATELLVDGAVEADLFLGLVVAVAAALNGIAIVRVYLLIFTGARHVSTVSLAINPRERLAVLTLAVLILLGGIFPQPGVTSRHRAADAILKDRAERAGVGDAAKVEHAKR